MASTELKPLTAKQQRVFDLLSQGKTHSEIANDMGIKSLSGIVSHVEALKKKGYVGENGAPVASAKPDEAPAPDISGNDDAATGTVEASSNGQHATFDLDSQLQAVVA